MHCKYCGEEIEDDSKFCKQCGKQISMDKKDNIKPQIGPLEIELPGIQNNVLKFTNNSLVYKEKTLRYTDIQAISTKVLFTRMNGIPTNQEFRFIFYGKEGKIKIFFSAVLKLGIDDMQRTFSHIYLATKKIIVPIIVSDLVKRIVDNHETIQIGSIYFNEEGYYKKNLFGKINIIKWSDEIKQPSLEKGRYILYEIENEKLYNFSEIAQETPNAIVIPELIKYFSTKSNSNIF